jgi:adenylate cyclase
MFRKSILKFSSSLLFFIFFILIHSLIIVSKFTIEIFILSIISGIILGIVFYLFNFKLLNILYLEMNLKIHLFFRFILIYSITWIFFYLYLLKLQDFEYINQFVFYLDSFFIGIGIFFFVLFRVISQISGTKKLKNLLFGKYFHPKREKRLFMFIDMKDSTSIAENIGLDKYHLLIRKFFFDLSIVINKYKGEIYNYVGDEVIISWVINEKSKKKDYFQCYFDLVEIIKRHISIFYKEYNVFVDFKTGMHVGNVIVGEIGNFERQIVFLGDVVNTASRIQGECNKYNVPILISKEVIDELYIPDYITLDSHGRVKLKGKENRIEIFSVIKKKEV